MQARRYGKTETQTTLIGTGNRAIGGPGRSAAWGPEDDEEPVGEVVVVLGRGF